MAAWGGLEVEKLAAILPELLNFLGVFITYFFTVSKLNDKRLKPKRIRRHFKLVREKRLKLAKNLKVAAK